jgi:CheY-like chemotaxis protein
MTGSIPQEKARILVAEDQPMNQLLIKKVLQRFNIGHIEIVKNGVEALKRYQESSWDAIFDGLPYARKKWL